MVYTDYTADNKAVQALVAGGSSRVRSSGSAVIPVSSGEITFGISVLSRDDTAAAIVRIFDTGDTDESAAVLLRTDVVSITDQGEDITAGTLTGWVQGDEIRYTWVITLAAPVGDWALEVSTNGTTAAVPMDFSAFSLVAPGTGGGSGDVTKVGTPANNQVGVWTGDGTLEGGSTLTFDGTELAVTGNITVTGTVDGTDIAALKTLADGAVQASTYNANTILAATADNTPMPLTVTEQTLVGRVTGGEIAALNVAALQTLIYTDGSIAAAKLVNPGTESILYSSAGGAYVASSPNSIAGPIRYGTAVHLRVMLHAVEVGSKVYIEIPEDLTIESWAIIADASGSIVLDLWSDTGVPTIADTITASAKPTLSAAQTGSSSTLTGWTTALVGGEHLVVNVDSVTTITNCTLTLRCVVPSA